MIIPFFIPHAGCPHQCVFCDQRSISGRRSAQEPSSIPTIINQYLGTRTDDGRAEVAFYGGSFTALPEALQRSYLEAVRPFLDAGAVESIRLSTRPDAITPDILALLKHYRVRTVELGAQSMDDEVLRLSGRGHTAAHTVSAIQLLRVHAFLIGIQLMPGLPGDSTVRFQETVTRIIALMPDFVRLYPALVIKDTPLAEQYRRGRYLPLSIEDAVDRCRHAMDRFEEAGISVSRVGLQPTEELERPGTIIAGPWHPAFRQLVDSSRFLESMRCLLRGGDGSGPVTFVVNPADLSPAIGQDRGNIRAIRDQYGMEITIIADPALPRGVIQQAPLP
jgi:histone acetyltransferase (RNA polymerase elongator complex component)